MKKLSLCPGVFFRSYNDIGIVFNTVTQNVCTINSVALDIVKLIGEKKEIAFDDLVLELKNEYSVDVETLSNDCHAFIKELQKNCIVSNTNVESVSTSDRVKSGISLEKDFSAYMCNCKQLFSCLIELTYKCNLECVHCYAKTCDRSANELSTSEFFKLIDDLYDFNVFKLTFTGGELFTRKDAYEIIKHAIEKGFLVDIFSNGTLLDDILIEKIANLHPRSFQSSIYSYIPSVHDGITGEVGSFDKTMTTLKKFAAYHVPINIKSVMMNINQEHYDGLEKLAESIGATFQAGLSISPKNDGDKTPCNYRIKDMKILKELFYKKQQASDEEWCFNNREEHSAICGAGWSSLSIDPFGNVYPCNSFNYLLGNVRNQKIEEIWNESSDLQRLRNLKIRDLFICRTCEYLNYCAFCPGMALLETGDMLQPYSEACTYAKIQCQLYKS